MTATEQLRKMLDELGVRWDYGPSGASSTAFWVNGKELSFSNCRDGLVCSTIFTPAQAIAAMLGEGTCHMALAWGDEYEGYCYQCSACGEMAVSYYKEFSYCPYCGRRAVKE